MRRVRSPVLILVPFAVLLAVFVLVKVAGRRPVGEVPGRDCLAPDIVRTLLSVGIDGKAIAPLADAGDCPDLRIILPAEAYGKIGPLVEKALIEANIVVLAREKEAARTGSRFRWRLQGPARARADIVFDIAGPPPPEPSPALAAIIIDDLGYNLEAVEALCRLGRPVTASILPFTPYGEEAARRASACGLETMLHLPLESLESGDGSAPEADGTILARMSAEDIRLAVTEYLKACPGCRGVNNHAGSKFTEEKTLLRPVFDVLKARNLYFIDSRTSPRSVAYEEAVRRGIRAATRRVFIDADSDPDGVRRRLTELFSYAKAHGKAVGIAHPRRATLEALARHLGLADEIGVKLVFASAVVK
jgi:polysaccharide deacetylase 2 family uncharacterized protein YibQ